MRSGGDRDEEAPVIIAPHGMSCMKGQIESQFSDDYDEKECQMLKNWASSNPF